jgi:hypothetical protein
MHQMFLDPTDGKIRMRNGISANFAADLVASSGTLQVSGAEAGDATLKLYADEGDDTADKWQIVARQAAANLRLLNESLTGYLQVSSGEVALVGEEAGNAALLLDADEGDDAADSWFIRSTASDNDLDFLNDTNIRMNLSSAGALGLVGSMTIENATAIPAGGTAGVGYKLSSVSNFGVFFGSGAPTLAAAQGSLYMRSDGSSTSTRMYINTDGGTTWTNVTTAA